MTKRIVHGSCARFVLAHKLLQKGCCGFLGIQSFIYFGEYTCTFVVHMVYGILVVDMSVYDT